MFQQKTEWSRNDHTAQSWPNMCSITWWYQAGFQPWLLSFIHTLGILLRGSTLHGQEHVPGCRILLHLHCIADVDGAPPRATMLHLPLCVWAPFQRRTGCREGWLMSRFYPRKQPGHSWGTIWGSALLRHNETHHNCRGTAPRSSTQLCALGTVLEAMLGFLHK